MTDRPVRVVVVHYGGHELTLECIDRLLTACGRPVEIVVVDNGGGRPIRESLDAPDNVSVRTGGPDLGFGGGANLALADLAATEFVALVNNDVLVEPDWLAPLEATLAADKTVGAAAPKILLRDRFRPVAVEVATTGSGFLDRRLLGLKILGARNGEGDLTDRVRFPVGTWGPEWSRGGVAERWTGGSAQLLVPTCGNGPHRFELLLAAPVPKVATFTAGGITTQVRVTVEPEWHHIDCDGTPLDILHNAGTSIDRDGYGADRGFLEPDGPRWSRSEDVFAWCGAAVLLRTAYLRDVGLFDPSLFLYYEDVELSWRGHRKGWRYRFDPDSVVRHVHSATAGRDPVGTLALNERNRLLVLARHGSLRRLARAVTRTAGVTLSYATRDVLGPMLGGSPVRAQHSTARIRALAGFAVRAPRALGQRGHGAAGAD